MNKKEKIALERGERLRELRKLSDLSRKAIERKYNVSANTITAWENPGKQRAGLSEEGARRMTHVYQEEQISCSLQWLLTGEGTPPSRHTGQTITEAEKFVDRSQMSIENEIAYFKKTHVEAIILEINDDSMMPHYRYGDIVGGVRCYAKDIPRLIGRNCIIETLDGRSYFRRLTFSTIPNRYNLVALNPDTKVERPVLYEINLVACAPVSRHWYGKKW